MARKLKGKSGKKLGSLRLQLLSHQVVVEKKGRKSDKVEEKEEGKVKKQVHHVPPLVPFDQDSKLLLVGEGDFSFTKTIVELGLIPPEQVIATSFDSLESLQRKYSNNINQILKYLDEQKVLVYNNVDCGNLIKTLKLSEKDHKKTQRALNNLNINTVMFNFPHTGKGMKDVDRNIKIHQELMVEFFASCNKFFELMSQVQENQYLSSNARVVISLFEGEPYDSWGIKKIARNFNYKLQTSGSFNWNFYQHYHHRRTNGTLKDTSKPSLQRNARIYIFEKVQIENEDE